MKVIHLSNSVSDVRCAYIRTMCVPRAGQKPWGSSTMSSPSLYVTFSKNRSPPRAGIRLGSFALLGDCICRGLKNFTFELERRGPRDAGMRRGGPCGQPAISGICERPENRRTPFKFASPRVRQAQERDFRQPVKDQRTL